MESIKPGIRVRVIHNQKTGSWSAYPIDGDESDRFEFHTLELHTVGVFGELKPDYAPRGVLSFVGTTCSHSTVDPIMENLATYSPRFPSKLFVAVGGTLQDLSFCRRMLIQGGKIYALVK